MAINAKTPQANLDSQQQQHGTIDTTVQTNHGDMLVYDINKRMYTPTATSVISLSNFRNDINSVTLSEVDEAINQALIDFQTGGTIDLSDYVTQTEVENMFDVYTPNIDLTAYALKTDIPTIPEVPTDVSQLTDINGLFSGNIDLTGYATEAYVADAIAEVNSGGEIDLSSYALKADIPTDVTQLTDVNNLLDHPTDVSHLTDTQGLLNVDLTPYALQTQLFSGDFNDLINTPTIFSGNYNDLTNQPIIPGDISQLTDNQGLLGSGSVDLTGYATETFVNNAIATIDHSTYALKTDVFSGNYNDLINTPVIFSGNYNDLINQPIIPADISQLTDTTGLLGQASVDLTAYALKTDLQTAIDGVTIDGIVSDTVANTLTVEAGWTLKPATNGLQDLGTLENPWNEIFLSSNSINLAGKVLTVDDSGDILIDGNAVSIPTDVSDLTDTTGLLDHVDLTPYVTSTSLNTILANYQPTVDLTPYALKSDIPTNIPSDVSDLTDTHDLIKDVDLTPYALKTDIPTVPAIPADISDLTDTHGLLQDADLTDYVTNSDLQTVLSVYQPTIDLSTYALKTDIPSVPADVSELTDTTGLLTHVDLTGYVTTTELQTAIDGITHPTTDLTGYATETYVTTAIANISATDLTAYALKTDIPSVPADVSELTDTTGLLDHTVVDLTPYALKSDLHAEPDLSVYALKTDLPTVPADVSDLTDTHGLLEHVDLTPYVTIASLPNFADFVTETELNSRFDEHHHHTSQEYALKTEIPTDVNQLSDADGLLNGTGSGTDSQTLTLMGNNLSISNGNTIDLSHLVTNSADNQLLSYDDQTYTLSIENGNSIDLSSLVSGGVDLSAYATEQWVNVQIANALSDAETINFATVEYVDTKHAEADIYGGKIFHGSVTFEDFVAQKVSTITHTAQKREYVMAVQTTNALQTEVLLNDATRIGIAQGTTAMFKATFVASDSSTNSASYVVRGIIDHNNAGIQLMGSNVLETIADNDQGWTVSVEVSPTSDSLSIYVQGSATIVDWTVFCEISEVIR